MKFINLTDKDINIRDNTGEIITFNKSGIVATVGLNSSKEALIANKFKVCNLRLNKVFNLPEETADTYYIVSELVMSTLNGVRTDVVSINSNTAKRNNDGSIILFENFVGVI